MKLLFITMTPLYHNTSAIIRTCGYISGASKNGHICDVITLESNENDYSYDSSNKEFVKKYIRNYYTFKKKNSYNALKTKKTDIHNNMIQKSAKKVLHWIFDFISIYDAQNINASEVLGLEIDYDQYDRIITVSDPISSYSIVFELLKANKVRNIESKWIQCWGDPWITDITKSIGAKKILVKREETKILSKAKKIIYASPFTLEDQKKKYPKYETKMFCINQTAQIIKDQTEMEYTYFVGYYGGYDNRIRNIMPLYNCCKQNSYKMAIAGGSNFVLNSTCNITVKPRLTYQEIRKLENDTAILISICNKRGNQIPGKVFYQAGYNKPIIIILDGELRDRMRDYFTSFHRYILCNNDEISIQKAIEIATKQIIHKQKYELDKRLLDTYCARKLLEF